MKHDEQLKKIITIMLDVCRDATRDLLKKEEYKIPSTNGPFLYKKKKAKIKILEKLQVIDVS